MIKKKRILAIIPARAGSKGLPNKNIIDLVGKPLIAWTIQESLKSKYITDTIVSSDSDTILKIATQYGAEIIKRPKRLATDKANSESIIKHSLNFLKQNKKEFDYIILLQPTSPLRKVSDIDKAFKRLFKTQANSLISVSRIDNKILKAFLQKKNGYLEGINNNQYPFIEDKIYLQLI